MLNAPPSQPPVVFKLLSHELRWQLVVALARSDQRVQELMQFLNRPQNLVSYHLQQLRRHELVSQRRSSADSRDIYYHLELARLQELFAAGGQVLHPALGPASGVATAPETPTAPSRVLFLCTHNSARSQMAEGLLRAQGGNRVQVASAGSQPATVHPLAVRTMADMGIDIGGQRSRHLDDFAGQSFARVITVCDRMREVCPVFPNEPEQIHWSIPDPAEVEGPEAVQRQAFQAVADDLALRIRYLLATLLATARTAKS